MRKAVFLDRDGVLIKNHICNGMPVAPTDGETPEMFDGVVEACAQLHRQGFLLVMITNQPDAVRGRTSRAFIDSVNDGLVRQLALDGLYVCFHDNGDNCLCRKPRPGLLITAANELKIDLSTSVMVGDRAKDVSAGHAAGCRAVLVNHRYVGEPVSQADHVADSLLDAVPWIIAAQSVVAAV